MSNPSKMILMSRIHTVIMAPVFNDWLKAERAAALYGAMV